MRLFRLMAATTLALMALWGAAVPASAQSTGAVDVKLVASCLCYGDTLTGWVAASGTGQLTVTLLQGSSPDGKGFTGTGLSDSVDVNSPSRTALKEFSFDIAGLDADYYMAKVTSGSQEPVFSRVISADECLPGDEIPEAPAAMLLPASLIGTAAIGGLLLHRRRRSLRLSS